MTGLEKLALAFTVFFVALYAANSGVAQQVAFALMVIWGLIFVFCD